MNAENSETVYRRRGKLISDVEESDKVKQLYRKHKLWLLKAKHHYSSLNFSKLLNHEILQHEREQDVDEKLFFKKRTLTRETLSGIINLNLNKPIEAYLVLNEPLSIDDLARDIECQGEMVFADSAFQFCSIKQELKRHLSRLKEEKVVLNQLSILKIETPEKYRDMLRTGILNFAIESSVTDNAQVLRNSFLAGILHDIGCLYLEPKYHNRAGKSLDVIDLKNIQTHTELGYHLLKPWFNSEITNAAINHHVGEDKSGYPRKTGIEPIRLSALTGFASSFVACLRKYKLENAMKIQELYSREESYSGEALKPFFKREFFDILNSLKLAFNKMGDRIILEYNRGYAVILHNFLVYIDDLGEEIKKLDELLLNYIRDKAAHRLDLQNDVDDVFDHIKKLNIIIKSCGKSPGLRRIMSDNRTASAVLGDIEIISMELHRNNRFLIGLFSHLNSKFADHAFESTVFKKARDFSNNIKRNISDQLEKEVSVFDLLDAISG